MIWLRSDPWRCVISSSTSYCLPGIKPNTTIIASSVSSSTRNTTRCQGEEFTFTDKPCARASDTVPGRVDGSGCSVGEHGGSPRSSSRMASRAGSSGFVVRADLRAKVAETEDTWSTERARRWIHGRIECQWSPDWAIAADHLQLDVRGRESGGWTSARGCRVVG